jgi:hypothetical protein
VKKTNNELHRLDSEIRQNMGKSRAAGDRAMKIISAQAPVSYRATLSGIVGGSEKHAKKRRKHRKKR